MYNPPMHNVANQLSQYGRYGDSVMVHMNPLEVQSLASLSPTGQLTTNPVTGQPEAFLLSGLGAFLGKSFLGKLLGSQLGSALGSTLLTTAVTGDLKKGIMSGISGYGFGNALEAASEAAAKAAAEGGSFEKIADIASAEAAEIADVKPEDILNTQMMQKPELIPQEPSLLPKTPSLVGSSNEFAQMASQIKPNVEPTLLDRLKGSINKEGIGAFFNELGKPGTILPIYVGEGNLAALEAQDMNRRRARKLGLDRERELERARSGIGYALSGIQRDYPGLRYTYGQGYAGGGQVKYMARGQRTDEDPPVVLPDPISVQAGLRGSSISAPPPVDYSALHQGGGGGYMPGLSPEFMYFGTGAGGGGGGGLGGFLPPTTGGGTFGGNQPSPGTAGPTNPFDWGNFLNNYFNPPRSDEGEEEEVNLEDMYQPPIIEPNVDIPSFDPSILQTINPLNYVSQPVKQGIVDVAEMLFPAIGGVKLLWNGADWIANQFGGDLPDDPLGVVGVGTMTTPTQEELDAAAANSTTQPEIEEVTVTPQRPLMSPTSTSSGSYSPYVGGGLSPMDLLSGESYIQQQSGEPWWMRKYGIDVEINSVASGGLITNNGVKRYQEGGPVMMDEPVDAVSNMEMMLDDMEEPETIDPRAEYDQLVSMTVSAIKGEIEEGADQIIEAFVAEYGPEAFAKLRDAVLNNIVPGAQTEGLIDGDGGGMDDMVDGMIGSGQRVAVSPGEYIIPADVVSGLGDGSTDAGAKALDELLDSVRMARTGTTEQPAPLFS